MSQIHPENIEVLMMVVVNYVFSVGLHLSTSDFLSGRRRA